MGFLDKMRAKQNRIRLRRLKRLQRKRKRIEHRAFLKSARQMEKERIEKARSVLFPKKKLPKAEYPNKVWRP